MIEFIVFSLSFLLLIAYKTLGKNLSRPSILYIGGFLICSIVAYNWKKEWGLEKMEDGTVFMIVGGALLFYLVELYDYNKNSMSFQRKQVIEFAPIKIRPIKLFLFWCFQLLSFYMMAKFSMEYAETEDLSNALAEMDHDKKFYNTVVKLPSYVSNSYGLCRNAGYIWCILLPYYQFKSSQYNKQKILIALNLITCLGGVLLTGGRMGLLNYFISYFCFFYICYQFKIRWKGGLLPPKIMAVILSLGIIFGVFFKQIGYAVGREENKNTMSMVFSIYCGAQIKNLDEYIRRPFKQHNTSDLFAQYTISKVYNEIAQRQGSDQSRHFSAELPFNTYGGYLLGNVYTTYYNYHVDFGYWGILCAGAMSLILSILYRKMLKSQFWRTGRLDLWIITYSWILSTAFLCFFANLFWGDIAIISVVKSLIMWWFMIFYLQGWRMSTRNNDIVPHNQDDTSVENVNPNEV